MTAKKKVARDRHAPEIYQAEFEHLQALGKQEGGFVDERFAEMSLEEFTELVDQFAELTKELKDLGIVICSAPGRCFLEAYDDDAKGNLRLVDMQRAGLFRSAQQAGFTDFGDGLKRSEI